MQEPDLVARRPLDRLGVWMLREVECVKTLAQGGEHTPMLRVLLGNSQPEHLGVEPLRPLDVGDPQVDVSQPG